MFVKRTNINRKNIVALWSNIIFIFIAFLLTGNLRASDYPVRIISLAPHITEIIFKLNAGSRLIGRTDFCKYPAAAQSIESVGGYLNMDFEKIVKLQPDLVLQFPNAENRRKLESLGFRTEDISNETIEEILLGIKKVGKLLNLEERAERVRQGIQDTLKLVADIGRSMQKHPSVLLLAGRQKGTLCGLLAAGKDTYLSQLWELCGGRNAFKNVPARYFPVNKEDLLKTDVNVILEFHPDWELTAQRKQKEKDVWQVFKKIDAVKQSSIYIFADRYFLIPGPRISKIAIKFSEIMKVVLNGSNE